MSVRPEPALDQFVAVITSNPGSSNEFKPRPQGCQRERAFPGLTTPSDIESFPETSLLPEDPNTLVEGIKPGHGLWGKPFPSWAGRFPPLHRWDVSTSPVPGGEMSPVAPHPAVGAGAASPAAHRCLHPRAPLPATPTSARPGPAWPRGQRSSLGPCSQTHRPPRRSRSGPARGAQAPAWGAAHAGSADSAKLGSLARPSLAPHAAAPVALTSGTASRHLESCAAPARPGSSNSSGSGSSGARRRRRQQHGAAAIPQQRARPSPAALASPSRLRGRRRGRSWQ